MATNAVSYIKNLGKSVSYAAVDKFKELTPTTTEFIETNQELFKETYSSIKNYRATYKKLGNLMKKSSVYEAAEFGAKSLLEDITTGKWYNKERIAEAESRFGGNVMDFSDMDIDTDFGGSSSSSDIDDWDGTDGDRLVSDSIQIAGQESAKAISMSVAKSSQYVVENQKASTSLLYAQNERMTSLLHNGLGAINEGINKVLKFSSESIQTHVENSKTFYETTTKLDQERNAILKEMLELQKKNSGMAEKKSSSSNALNYEDIISSDGVLDLKAYGKNISKNVKNVLDGFGGGMLGGLGEGSNVLAMMVASPMQFVLSSLMNKVVTDNVQNAAKNLDKTVSGFFGSLIAKLNNMKSMEDSPILNTIGKIFGINIRTKDKIDTDKYEKGAIPFDGVTKKAIIEVIPGYLAQMVSLMSGKSAKIFDYESGKYTDIETINKNKNIRDRSYQDQAMSELKEELYKSMQNTAGLYSTIEEFNELQENMQKFFTEYYKRGFFDFNDKNILKNLEAMDIDDPRLAALLKSGVSRQTKMTTSGKIATAKGDMRKYYEAEEAKGSSVLTNLVNNSNMTDGFSNPGKYNQFGGMLLGSKDSYGKDIFFYLRNMYEEVSYLRYIVSNGGGGGTTGGKRKRKPNPIKPMSFDKYTGSLKKLESSFENPDTISDSKKESFARQQAKNIEKAENKGWSVIDPEKLSDDIPEEDQMAYISALISTNNLTAEELNKLGSSDRDKVEKLMKKANGNTTDDGKKDSFLNRLLEAESITAKSAVIFDSMKSLTSKPMEIIEGMFTTVDKKLFDVIYGIDVKNYRGQEAKGFLDILIIETKYRFGELNEWINTTLLEPLKEKIGVKQFRELPSKILGAFGIDTVELGEQMKEYLFGKKGPDNKRAGGILGDIRDSIKETFSGAWNYVKESMEYAFPGPAKWLKGKKAEYNKRKQEREAEKKAQEEIDKKADEAANEVKQTEAGGKLRGGDFSALSKDELIINRSNNKASWIGKTDVYKMPGGKNDIFDVIAAHDNPFNTNPVNRSKNRMDERAAKSNFAQKIADSIFEFEAGTTGYKFGPNTIFNFGKNRKWVKDAEIIELEKRARKGDKDAIAALNSINSTTYGDLERRAQEGDESAIAALKVLKRRGIKDLASKDNRVNDIMRMANAGDADAMASKKAIERHLQKEARQKSAQVNNLRKKSKGSYTDMTFGDQMLKEGHNLVDGISKFVKGSLDIKNDNKAFGDMAKDFMEKAGLYAPDMISHGLLGGGVSLLTGAIGGPLLGAGIGAAIGFVKRSEAAQKFLFGEETDEVDENGERIKKGGVFSDNFQKTIKNYFPEMSKLGIAGGVTGLFTPFGPVGGLLIGSAIGFVKKNKAINEFLFGNEEQGKEGLIPKKTQDYIKKSLPKAALGAVAGMLTGPFGLVGNLAVGAGIGLFTGTDKFKEMIFGKTVNGELQGGLMGFVREDIIRPIKEDFLPPFKKSLELLTKGLFDGIRNTIDNIFENTFGITFTKMMKDYIFNPLKKVTGGLFKLLLNPAKFILSAPSKILGGIGNSMRMSQIYRGQADYMTAAERLKFRQDHKVRGMGAAFRRGMTFGGPTEFRSDDAIIADMSTEDLEALSAGLSEFSEIGSNLKSEKRDLTKKFGKQMDPIHSFTARKIMKNIIKMDYSKAKEYVQNYNIPEEEKAKILDYIEKNKDTFTKLSLTKSKLESTKKGTEGLLQGLGLKGFDLNKSGDYLNYIQAELKNRKGNSDTDTEVKDSVDSVAGKIQEQTKEQMSKYDDMINLLRESNKHLRKVAGGDHEDIDFNPENPINKITKEFNDILHPDKGKSLKKKISKAVKDTTEEVVEENEEGNLNGEEMSLFDKLKASVGNFKKKGTEKVQQFVPSIGKWLTFKKNEDGEHVPDTSSKETSEGLSEMEEKKGIDAKISESMSGIGSLFGKVKDGFLNFFGVGSDKEKEPWYEKIVRYGGAIFSGATILGALPHINNFMKEKVVPGIGNVYNNHIMPVINKHFPKLGNMIDAIVDFFGVDNQGRGPLQKIGDWFAHTAMPWVADKFPPFFKEKIIPYYVGGIEYLFRDIMPYVAKLLVQTLPSILSGALAGLGEILRWDIGDIMGRKPKGKRPTLKTEAKFDFSAKDVPTTKYYKEMKGSLGVSKNTGTSSLNLSKNKYYTQEMQEDAKDSNIIVNVSSDGTNGGSYEGGEGSGLTFENPFYSGSTESEPIQLVKTDGSIVEISEEDYDKYSARSMNESRTIGGSILKGTGRAFLTGSAGVFENMAKKQVKKGGKLMFAPLKYGAKATEKAFSGAAKAGRALGLNKSLSDVFVKKASESPMELLEQAGVRMNKSGRWIGSNGKYVSKDYVQQVAGDLKIDLSSLEGTGKELTEKAGAKAGKEIAESTGKAGAKAGKEILEGTGKELVEKGTKEVAEKAGKEAIENASKGIFKTFTDMVTKAIKGLFDNNTVLKAFKEGFVSKGTKETAERLAREAAGEAAEGITKKLIPTLTKNLSKNVAMASAKIGAAIGSAGLITVAFAVTDFASGWRNANTIMGVTRPATIVEKIICGILRAISGLCLGLIPEDIVMDIVIDYIAPLFNIDVSKLQEDRATAESDLIAFREEMGDDSLTLEDYNNRDKWDYKLKKWAGGKIKDGWNATKEWAGNAWDKTKEWSKNAWNATKEGVGKAWDKTKEWAGDAWDATKKGAKWLGGKIKDAGDWYTNGIFNDSEIRKQLGLKPDQEITLQDRISMGGAKFLEKLSFGTIDSEDSIKKINGAIEIVKNKATETWENIKKDTAQRWEDLKTGAVEAVQKANTKLGALFGMQDDEGNPISLTEGISDKWNKWKTDFKQGWEDIKKQTSETWENIKKDTAQRWEDLKTGAVEAVQKANTKLGALFGMVDESGKPMSLTEGISYNWENWKAKAAEGWNSVKSKASEAWSNLKEDTAQKWENLKNDASAALTKLDSKLGALFGMEDENGRAQSLSEGVKEKFNATTSKLRDGWNSVKEKASGFWEGIKKWFGNIGKTLEDSSDGAIAARGGSSSKSGRGGSNYQVDPSISGMRFNNPYDTVPQTIGDSGCGPAAAAMYMNNACTTEQFADMAIKGGYKDKNGGVRPEFFKAAFASNGMQANYINPMSARNMLNNGSPVILMGESSGINKQSSPFTPYGHYVIARGMQGNNIFIEDPENMNGLQSYDASKILSQSSVGIVEGSGLGRRRVYGSGRGTVTAAQLDAVFGGVLKGKGQTLIDICDKYAKEYNVAVDPALIAAIMIHETGNGTSNAIRNNNNPGGIMDPKTDYSKLKTFSSLNEGIDYTVYNIAKGYLAKGHTSLEKIGSIYCPVGAANDPKGLNKHWIPGVAKFYKDITGKDYEAGTYTNGIPTGSTSAPAQSNTGSALARAFAGVTAAYASDSTNMYKKLLGDDLFDLFGQSTFTPSSEGTDSSQYYGSSSNSMLENFVQIALNEEGYKEKRSNKDLDSKTANTGSNNYTKYGKHFGSTGPGWPWCAQFVSWSADQAGIPKETMTRSASVYSIYSDLKKKGKIKSRSQTPNRGDIVFFGNNTKHIGIVTGMKDGQVKTIEGNSSDSVRQRSYSPGNSYISSYGDLGIGVATGNTGLDGNSSTTNATAYGSFNPFKNNKSGRGTIVKQPPKVNIKPPKQAGSGGSSDNDSLIKSIIEILLKVLDNTDKLDRLEEIVALLSKAFGEEVGSIKKTGVTSSTATSSKKKELSNLVSKLNTNNSSNSNEQLLKALQLLARE